MLNIIDTTVVSTTRTTTGISVGSTTSGRSTISSEVSLSPTGTTSEQNSGTNTATTSTLTTITTKRCEEMQAVTGPTSDRIVVKPIDLPGNDKREFLPTSNKGVSFPESEKRPTIIIYFDKPAEVQSITIPRDKTPDANVAGFDVIFYSPEQERVNIQPIRSSSSPRDDKSKPATLESKEIPSDTKVSRVEITISSTTDGNSPKGVVLDIKACTEMTTGEYCFPDYLYITI